MTSPARQTLAADLAAVLTDPHGPAEQATIDGRSLAVIRQPEEWAPADGHDGAQVQSLRLWCLAADLGTVPVPWQDLVLDGERWTVAEVPCPGPVVEMVLRRYVA